MKRVILCDAAAAEVERMRDSIGSYESTKCQIADAMCRLAKILNYRMDGTEEPISYLVNDVVEAMNVISDYNALVDGLSTCRDMNFARYTLEKPEEDISKHLFDRAPNERELEIIEKILESKNVKLPDLLPLSAMTITEIANVAGMGADELNGEICCIRISKNRREVETKQ